MPAPVSSMPCRTTMLRMLLRCAPSAMRTPMSCVPCVTRDTTSRRRRRPTASSSANTANAPSIMRREALPRHRVAHPVGHRLDVVDGNRRVHLMNLAHDGAGDRRGIGRPCGRRDRTAARRRAVDDDAAVDVEAVLLYRADDADDRHLAASDRSRRACRSASPSGQKRWANFSSMMTTGSRRRRQCRSR